MKKTNAKRKVNYTFIMFSGFLFLVFLGAVLLMLPFASRTHLKTNFIDCIFTSTSAVCVTGLTPFDVYTHWSPFGQAVIIFLIQIGGLGFMTLISFFALFFKKSMSINEKNLVMQSTGSLELGGLKPLLKKILVLTFSFEFIGGIILSTQFYSVTKSLAKALLYGLFHSVSAFCNAGFDLCGIKSPGSSLFIFRENVLVNITVCVLIISGGLGFIVWENIIENKGKFKKFDFHSKLVLTVTLILIIFGSIFFFFSEKNASMKDLSASGRALSAFFQSATLRTAGFSTIDQGKLSSGGHIISVLLMAIGGSPGSTAGGIKTTTFAVFIISMIFAIRRKKDVVVFKKRFSDDAVHQSSAIIGFFSIFVLAATVIICTVDGFPISDVLFETVSAAGTVGLTTGITPELSAISKAIVSILMFGGRVGGFSIMIMLAKSSVNSNAQRPVGKVLIG